MIVEALRVGFAETTLPRRILVTGGAGFIGSHLCERLLADGHEVLCVDNYFTGSRSNIAQTTKTSVHGAINILGLAKRRKVPVLQASTSEVYGDPTMHPQTEGYWGNVNPIGIRSCYDEGKRCAETLFFDYHRQHELLIKVARIFNTYDTRMHPEDGRVVSNFIVQALQGKPLTLYGTGQQSRSFCYVSDLVDGLVKLMDSPAEVTGPINLGNPVEFTMAELAQKVIALTGSKAKTVTMPLPADDPVRRCPDIITRAEKILKWRPTIGIDDGLRQTIAYFTAMLAEKAST